jgi:hypothetical protein
MALGGALALAFSPKISPGLVLRLYRARELRPPELPPSLLRSHPPTEQRIARLRELQAAGPAAPAFGDAMPWGGERARIGAPPRGHVLGFWY